MEVINDKEQLVANLLEFDSYRGSSRSDEREFYRQRLRLGKIFACLAHDGRLLLCPSRFAGYQNNTMAKHLAFEKKSGSITTPRITSLLGVPHDTDGEAETAYLALCAELEVEPSAKQRTYWRLDAVESPAPHLKASGDAGFPDEVSEYFEGAAKKVYVNAYERNPVARRACIAHYGCACIVCGFDFERAYGKTGRGFIHVHHLVPLARHTAQYQVDPIKDLRPVCPNCHAMLHLSDPPFSIEEMQELVASAALAEPNRPLELTG